MTRPTRAQDAQRGRPDLSRIKRALLAWYAEVRSVRELPWRTTSDPYAIWVSETMLQQTRATTAIPYWERFLRELPTVHTLAEAPQERVLALWSGLGYYRRARMLHAAARRVVSAHGGELPRDVESLRALEGVGSYTAGAIASIAFKQRVAAVDGNVTRVLSRILAIEDGGARGGAARIRAAADALAAIEEGDPGDWSQALMELGALVCTPRQPRCASCPASADCQAKARGEAFVAALPAKAAKAQAKPKKTVHLVALVLTSKRGVVLGRRPGRREKAGLYAGLWEPPLASRAAVGSLATRLGVDVRALHEAGQVVHVLSHRRMVVQVLRGHLPSTSPLRGRAPETTPHLLGPGPQKTNLGRAPETQARGGPHLLGPGPQKTNLKTNLGRGPETQTGETPTPYETIQLVPYKDIPARAHATLTRKVLDMAKVRP
jgi:A/G-specific adenine glycosylase